MNAVGDINVDDFELSQGALIHLADSHRVLNGVIDEYSLCYGKRTGDWFTDYQNSLIVRFNEHPQDNGFIVYQSVVSCMLRLPHIRTIGQLMALYEALGGEM